VLVAAERHAAAHADVAQQAVAVAERSLQLVQVAGGARGRAVPASGDADRAQFARSGSRRVAQAHYFHALCESTWRVDAGRGRHPEVAVELHAGGLEVVRADL